MGGLVRLDRTAHAPQDLGKLGPGDGAVGQKGVAARAGEEALLQGILHRAVVPGGGGHVRGDDHRVVQADIVGQDILLLVRGGVIVERDKIEDALGVGAGHAGLGQGLAGPGGVPGLQHLLAPLGQGLGGKQIGLPGLQGGVGARPGSQLAGGGHGVAHGAVLAVQHLVDAVAVQVGEVVHLHPHPVGLGLDIEDGVPRGPVHPAVIPHGVIGQEQAGTAPAIELDVQIHLRGVGGVGVDEKRRKAGGQGVHSGHRQHHRDGHDQAEHQAKPAFTLEHKGLLSVWWFGYKAHYNQKCRV